LKKGIKNNRGSLVGLLGLGGLCISHKCPPSPKKSKTTKHTRKEREGSKNSAFIIKLCVI